VLGRAVIGRLLTGQFQPDELPTNQLPPAVETSGAVSSLAVGPKEPLLIELGSVSRYEPASLAAFGFALKRDLRGAT
jgi:hypothetical protein